MRAMRLILPVHILPDGITSVALLTAAIASSGEIRYCCSLSGIERDDDGSLVAAERRRRGDAGQRREQGPHAVEREILQFALRVRGAAENQLTHRHAARIEARDEGRHRSRRHEGAGAVHIADRLRHRLRHVGAFVKHQLHQRRALDALALDVIDSGDVEEVILVVISEVAFHLRRVHAAVRLRDVDRGLADLREDVHRHALERRERRQSAMAISATTTVIGRLRAARTRRMVHLSRSLAGLGKERLNVSGRGGDASKPRQTPSRASASSISAWVSRRCASATSSMLPSPLDSARSPARSRRARPRLARACSRPRSWRPRKVATAPFQRAFRSVSDLLVARRLRPDGGGLPRFPRANRGQIEDRKGHAETRARNSDVVAPRPFSPPRLVPLTSAPVPRA